MGKQTKKTNVDGMIGISQRFAVLNRLITRDMNNNTSAPTFSLYSKDNITEYLTNPYTYEKQLRKAVTYIYGASSHFRRLIQYFTGLSDFAYVVSPYRIDPKSVNVKSVNRNYRKPLQSSSTLSGSSDSNAATDEGGAPQKDTGDLTDSGEQTREDGDDW